MGKKRTKYIVQLGVDPQTAEQVVQSYLASEGFILKQDRNESYYIKGDAMVGYKEFKYGIEGNMLIMFAWMGNMPVEGGGLMGAVPRNTYSNSIKNGIISRLNPQNVTNTNVNAKEAVAAQNNVPTIMDGSIQASIEQGQAKNNRSAEVYCEIGFWISIAAVAINLIYLGINDAPIVGAFLIFAAIYGGVRGLNTRKRKKAILTFVFLGVAVVLTIVNFVKLFM